MPSEIARMLDADWKRLCEFSGAPPSPRRWKYSYSPRFATVVLIRKAHALHNKGWIRLAKLHSLINYLVFGIEVPAKLEIGEGLVIPHPNGTIIGAGHVGKNVTIYQQVTLGAKLADFSYDPALRPHVCDGVIITAGAKIIGPVHLGENCIIGANSVVLQDIPSNALAVGVPAKVNATRLSD